MQKQSLFYSFKRFFLYTCDCAREEDARARPTVDLNGINGCSALFLDSNLSHPSGGDGRREGVWLVSEPMEEEKCVYIAAQLGNVAETRGG